MKDYRFALCIENRDCEDLDKRKIYQLLPDHDAEEEGYLRIIDESDEDHLYPQSDFVLIQLPREAQEALRALNSLFENVNVTHGQSPINWCSSTT